MKQIKEVEPEDILFFISKGEKMQWSLLFFSLKWSFPNYLLHCIFSLNYADSAKEQ